jgi:hypothetical protein
MAEPNIKKAIKIWAALVVAGLAASSLVAVGLVNSSYYTGTINVQCSIHLIPSQMSDGTEIYLYVDGAKVAERYAYNYGGYDGYGGYDPSMVWFDPVTLKANTAHTAWVIDDSGHSSEKRTVRVPFHEQVSLNFSLGNLSTVSISVHSSSGLSSSTNKTVFLYADGDLLESTLVMDNYGEWDVSFTEYLEMDRTYQIKAVCEGHDATDELKVDEYYEYITLYI